jgi:8-oxo-dGTP pyrophosphatase MutT (NUDIX family)
MIKVCKALIYNPDGEILLLMRSDTHPEWPLEGDFPGGCLEYGENEETTTAREIEEETSIKINPTLLKEVFNKRLSDKNHLIFELYLNTTPEVKISWEHSSYQWVDPLELINNKALHSSDDYFQTVLEYLTSKL